MSSRYKFFAPQGGWHQPDQDKDKTWQEAVESVHPKTYPCPYDANRSCRMDKACLECPYFKPIHE